MKGNYGVKADRVLVLIVLLAAVMLQGCSKMGKEEVIDEVELTDTVRWFNTSYALLTEMNKWKTQKVQSNSSKETIKQQKLSSDSFILKCVTIKPNFSLLFSF